MKWMQKIFTILSIVVFGFMILGCSGTPIHVESVQPKLYENSKDKGKEISATASGFQLLLFIPIEINDRHKRAYDLLKAQANDGYITDVKVQESWSYAFVGTVYTTTITATVYPKIN